MILQKTTLLACLVWWWENTYHDFIETGNCSFCQTCGNTVFHCNSKHMLCGFSKITVACRDTKHACSLSYIWSSTPSNIHISNSPLTLLLSTFIGFRLEPGILIRYCLSPNIHTSNCPLNSVLSTFISLRLELGT